MKVKVLSKLDQRDGTSDKLASVNFTRPFQGKNIYFYSDDKNGQVLDAQPQIAGIIYISTLINIVVCC